MSKRYSHVQSRKKEGAHYTPSYMAEFIALELLSNVSDKEPIKVVDPAIGDGELILSFLGKCKDKAVVVHGFDVNFEALELAKSRIHDEFPEVEIILHHESFIDYCLQSKTTNELDLFKTQKATDYFDFLIANPPYIRTQNLGEEQVKKIASNFNITGRLDIYQAFLLGMKYVLKENALAGVIVSNRFMTTKGCETFRNELYSDFRIEKIYDFGDSKVFEAAVLPAVLILKNTTEQKKKIPFYSIYSVKDESGQLFEVKKNPVAAIKNKGIYQIGKIGKFITKHGWLDFNNNASNPWKLVDLALIEWQKTVDNNTFCKFNDFGKIRVGVKTTADKVFIRNNFNDEVNFTPELVKPLITHHVSNQYFRENKNLKQILYTHYSCNGKKIAFDLEEYPKSKEYLNTYKEILAGRSYLAKSNRNWYEIWVPQDPSLWNKSKIVFRDISEKPTFWIEPDDVIVNGDCYWFVKENVSLNDDIIFLILGVANSKFIEEYYDNNFGNKLYSNRRRFMTQYVAEFPIPDPKTQESIQIIKLVKEIVTLRQVASRKKEQLDELVYKSFGLN